MRKLYWLNMIVLAILLSLTYANIILVPVWIKIESVILIVIPWSVYTVFLIRKLILKKRQA